MINGKNENTVLSLDKMERIDIESNRLVDDPHSFQRMETPVTEVPHEHFELLRSIPRQKEPNYYSLPETHDHQNYDDEN